MNTSELSTEDTEEEAAAAAIIPKLDLEPLFQNLTQWISKQNYTNSTVSDQWLSWIHQQQQYDDHLVTWDDLACSVREEYLLHQLGPKQRNFKLSVALTTLYSLLFLVGFFGNLLTCVIIFFNSYMRVPPNFFLFSLAIADIIALTGGKK